MKDDYLHQEVEEAEDKADYKEAAEVKKKEAKKEKKNVAELSKGTTRIDR